MTTLTTENAPLDVEPCPKCDQCAWAQGPNEETCEACGYTWQLRVEES